MSIEEVATWIGVSRFTVADAQRGKPSTGIAVYDALLRVYRLLDQMTDVASTSRDLEGLARISTRKRAGSVHPADLDNNF